MPIWRRLVSATLTSSFFNEQRMWQANQTTLPTTAADFPPAGGRRRCHCPEILTPLKSVSCLSGAVPQSKDSLGNNSAS